MQIILALKATFSYDTTRRSTKVHQHFHRRMFRDEIYEYANTSLTDAVTLKCFKIGK